MTELASTLVLADYAHPDRRSVNTGVIVERQQIGTMGCTGFATGVHLHIGVVDRDPPGLGYLGYNFNQHRVADSTGRVYYLPSLFFSSPILRVDGGVRSSRPQGGTFIFVGSGYTPNRKVNLRIRYPNGTEYDLPSITADSTGRITFSLQTRYSAPIGNYILWAIDDTTGRGWFWSNHVEMVITRGQSGYI